jgi:hypothetical protein
MSLETRIRPRAGHLRSTEEDGPPSFQYVPLRVDSVDRSVLFEPVVGIVFDVQMACLGVDIEDGLVSALPGVGEGFAGVGEAGFHREIVTGQLQKAAGTGSVSHPNAWRGYPPVHSDL